MSEASTSALKARIMDDVKIAMKAGEKPRLAAIRLIQAALKQKEVDERIVLGDADVIAILDKMCKQRRESIEQYKAAGRADLEQQEAFELDVIQTYLPTPLSDEEIQSMIAAAISSTGASGIKDMGAVMNLIRPQAQGRADMAQVSARIKAALGG
ncbi:MAG: GatB/YqeY domain-containing protein [Pseudomonadota bacterium]